MKATKFWYLVAKLFARITYYLRVLSIHSDYIYKSAEVKFIMTSELTTSQKIKKLEDLGAKIKS